MLRGPCKDCPDRHIACGVDCEKYLKYREENEKVKEAKRRESMINLYESTASKRYRH